MNIKKTTRKEIYPKVARIMIDKWGKEMVLDMECMAVCGDGTGVKPLFHQPNCPRYRVSLK